MIEAGLAFMAGIFLTPAALIILAIIGILFEHNGARGWAVFTGLLLAVVAYFFFAVPLITILIGAVGYIAIGLVWSVWRYKRHVSKTIELNKDSNEAQKERVLAQLHPREMLSTFSAWVLIWPFSFVEHVAGDLINAIQTLISKVFRGVYFSIYNSAVAELKK